ncbi:MAG: aminoacyl-tRNA hydrolase [Candidatus Pacebacteria bacterium]|nr:aminoacyl-tRNA hydrolase [Candidatus Paceibacterota bacterium]
MILIAGLGNPGEKYKETWHNLGFKTIDEIAAILKFPDFELQSISDAEISKGKIGSKEVVLVKPQTFMNNSGEAIRKLFKNYKLKASDLIVIHDDIDLPLGKIKIVSDRGAAGHKGVESIINHLGTQKFVRIRMGMQPEKGKPRNAENFVLRKFKKKEVKDIIKKASEAIRDILARGLEKAMNSHNKDCL